MIGTKSVRQLALLAKETLSWKTVFLNKFVIIIVLGLVLWAGMVQPYITANDDGTISGTVVDSSGEPVEGATVVAQRLMTKNQEAPISTTTNENGQFVFEDKTRWLEFRIHAEKSSVRTETERHHLYFRGQNTDLTIVLDQ
ncbi:carboxypeptidase-like regulatory domain-containing protein [Haloferax sp. YSMS24]|uniref:carboxypeptidase-like regulatory domain-containing protein n=1 Tax=Haloferax sp. YSMS24 TaxID=3388425 RepID=UPI00398D2407